MTVWLIGSLGYHDETIVEPIIDEFNKRHVQVSWFKPDNVDGANVHVEQCTSETLKYWVNFTALLPKLRKNDVVFILDFWNPIIFEFKFWSTRNNLDIKFYTLHHGSSHLPGDFASTKEFEWALAFENAWKDCYDKIFFGSMNAANQFPEMKNGARIVSYLPVGYMDKIAANVPKDIARITNRVIMPLRLDDDKGATEFFEIVANNPDYEFVALAFHCNVEVPKLPNLTLMPAMDRQTLFSLMATCEYAISCAKQETFGYGILEAVKMGCKPILQKSEHNCYNEMYDESCLFEKNSSVKIGDYRFAKGLKNYTYSMKAEEVIVKGILF